MYVRRTSTNIHFIFNLFNSSGRKFLYVSSISYLLYHVLIISYIVIWSMVEEEWHYLNLVLSFVIWFTFAFPTVLILKTTRIITGFDFCLVNFFAYLISNWFLNPSVTAYLDPLFTYSLISYPSNSLFYGNMLEQSVWYTLCLLITELSVCYKIGWYFLYNLSNLV